MNDDDSLATDSPVAAPNEDVVEESAEESVEAVVEPTPEVSAPPSECPVAATGLSAEAGNNEVTLSWSPGEGPEDNDRFTDPTAFYVSVTSPESKVLRTTETTLTVLGLRNGVEYSFEVFTATAAGRSAAAGPVRATPTTGMEGVVAGLIVEFADGVDPQPGATDVPGQERVAEVDLVVAEKVADDAVLVELSEPVDLDTAQKIAADLAADDQVEWAEPDQFFFTSSEDVAQTVSVPTDSQYASNQWNLWDSFGISVGDGNTAMTDAWAGPRGDGVTVAVIDTGITAHPDLDGQLVSGHDFVSNPEQLASSRQANAPPVDFDGDYIDEATYGALGRDANPTDPGDWRGVAPIRDSSWHGTKIAGLIAAASNADGITGIAPAARIQPIRALSWRGGLLSDIAASITWASGGAIDGVPANENPSKVINMSFAVEAMCPVALQQAIDGALERGSILVAAAGNASDDAAKYAPGNCNGVITVAATNRDGNRADYSNYGATIDIAAPGGDYANPITTTSNTGVQAPDQSANATDSGTSIAAAHVSAAAAILLSRNASITPSNAYTRMTGSEFTKAFNNEICDTSNPDYGCGTGILSLAQVTSGTCAQTERVVGGFIFIAFTAPGGVTCTSTWTPPAASVRVDYLVVGGGGGGGAGRGGGGGAGGFIGSTTPIDIAGPTTVQVGGGGVGGSNTPNNGTSGADSKLGTFAGAVAKGGGYGAGWNSGIGGVGGNGGSGGGASGSGDAFVAPVSRDGGSGESGQGSSGGSNAPQSQCPGWGDTGSYYCTGGGGGGAASAGTFGSTYTDASVVYRKAGNGGAGKPAPAWMTASARTALGIPSFYAGGGGGAGQYASRTPGGDGGTGGGGDGCGSGVCNGEPGTANTGGGGGGSEGGGSQAGDGGSGIVVIRYASSCAASAPTTSGVYTVVNFTTAGSCTWTAPSQVRSIDVLAVGGGGGGGAWVGGGGGGGEVTDSSGVGVTPGNSYPVKVGAGGRGAEMRPGFSTAADAFVSGGNGTSSSFGSSVTALGGGVGGSANLQAPGSGDTTVATGGGAPFANVNPGVGKVSSGGVAGTSSQPHPTGGGGGAQSAGGSGQGVSPYRSGAGGAGKVSTITGVTYGGGGGGSAHGTWPTGTTLTTPTNEPGAGGDGGGGTGGRVTTATLGAVVQGVAGTDGLGGGGGGAANMWDVASTSYNSIGGDGGDGTVIVRYFSNALATNAGGGVQPGNYTIGSGWVTAPKVQLVSAAGATITTVNVSITATFAASSGSATLASATAVTDANGVADFSGMTMSGAAGTSGTLTFTATGYGPVTSTSFSIVRAAQGALTVTSTSGTYGTALSLTTSGGSGTGAVTYSAANGTALGCTVSGSSLTVTQAGTCLVTATKAEDASYSATSSPQTTVTFAKAQQSALSIDGPYSLEYGETFPLTTTGGSGTGAVSYSRNGTTGGATCTVANAGSSSTVKGTKAGGTCLVGATKAGDVNYDPVLVEQAFTITTRAVTVTASSPSVTYPTPISQSYSVTSGTLATGDAISSITYTYQGTGSTTYGPSTTAPTGAGTYSVTPSAATFSAGLASNYAIQYQPGTVTISQAPQATLTMSSPSSAIVGQSLTLTASGGSGTGALSFAVTSPTGPGLCSLSGTTLTLGDAGSLCKVQATKAASTNYLQATSAEQTILISKAGQTIAFTSAVPSTPLPNGTYTPTASAISTVTGAWSGVAPSFAASGVCSLTGGVVTFTATGTCTITASAAGTTNFTAAADATQVIEVGALNQTISFTQPSNTAFGSSGVAMAATASSGLSVAFTLGAGTTNGACTVTTLGVVTISAVGTCEVVAAQAGDAQYAAASNVTRAFQVVPALATAPSLTSASASSEAITVSFTAPGFTGGVAITAYEIVAAPTGAGSPVSTSACPASPCTITGLVNGTEYRVTVAAVNSAGTGPASSTSTPMSPATAAFAVGSLTAVPGDTTVTVSWTQPADLGGGTFVRYDVYHRIAGTGTYGSATVVGNNSIGTTTTTFTGLDNGTSYDFKVVAITTANGSEIPGNTAEVVQYPSTVPSAPRTPVVLAATATDVQFSWSAPLSIGGAVLTSPNYAVTVTGSAGAASVTCTPTATSTNCTATGLTNGASYAFSVVATNRMGNSPAATVTYDVPSSVATLSNLFVTSSPGSVELSPSFASGTTNYTATVPNGVSAVTLTPTTTSAGATVTVDGVAVVSGSSSAPIALAVGSNAIAVVVTASDPRFSQTYTVTVTRAAAPGGGGGGPTPADQARTPMTPPLPVSSGSTPGGVMIDGVLDGAAVFAANGTNSGWTAITEGFTLSVRTESPNGSPMAMTPQGAMQVPQGGFVVMSGTDYQPSSQITVFAIPRNQGAYGSTSLLINRMAVRSSQAPVYLGSATVSSSGSVAATLTVPMSVDLGSYVLQVNGLSDTDQVRSVNMLMDVIPGPPSMAEGLLREAAFYKGASAQFSANGRAKLRSMVESIPSGASSVEITVVGVSTALETPRANLRLARDRAEGIVAYFKAAGVKGQVTVSLSTTFDLRSNDASEASSSAINKPMTSSTGKPLTTATIAFTATE